MNRREDDTMRMRGLVAPVVAAVAVLQAWDSGVFDAGWAVILLVMAAASLLAVAVLLGATRRLGVPALVAGAILIVTARVVSPTGLNELFVILPIAVMPFLFDAIAQQRKRNA